MTKLRAACPCTHEIIPKTLDVPEIWIDFDNVEITWNDGTKWTLDGRFIFVLFFGEPGSGLYGMNPTTGPILWSGDFNENAGGPGNHYFDFFMRNPSGTKSIAWFDWFTPHDLPMTYPTLPTMFLHDFVINSRDDSFSPPNGTVTHWGGATISYPH